MPILPAFLAAISLVGTIIGLYYWHNSYRGTTTRKYSRLATLIGVIVFLTLLFVSIPSAFGGNRLQTTPTPTTPNQQIGADSTPTQVSQSFTPTPSPTPVPPTPTSAPQPHGVLYQANSAWSGWSGTKEWNVLNGMLENDGTGYPGQPTILAPDVLQVSDYAVEANIQVVNWHRCCYSQFAIVVRASTNSYGSWQGYSVGEDLEDRTPSTAELSAHAGDFGSSLGNAPFDPGAAWHTYRIEVKGDSIKLLIDGGVKFAITDNTYLSGGQVGFWSYEVQLNISSFKIIAL